MVVFICNACGNSVKKSRVEKHYQTECPGCSVLSCIDCGKDFTGEEYQAHTSCISEAEKYQGKLFTESDRTKSNKGERKQQEWLQKVQEVEKTTTDPGLVRYLKMIAAYPNVPRKQAKFENFAHNSLKLHNPRLLAQLWDVFSKGQKQKHNQAQCDEKPEPCREMDTATSVEDHTHKDTMEVSEEGMSCDPDPSSSKGKKSKKKRKHKEKTVKEEDSSKQQSSTEDEPVAKKAKKLKKKKKSHDTESSVIVSDGEGCEEEMDGLVLKTASNSETKFDNQAKSHPKPPSDNDAATECPPKKKRKKEKKDSKECGQDKTEDCPLTTERVPRQLDEMNHGLNQSEDQTHQSTTKTKKKRKKAPEVEGTSSAHVSSKELAAKCDTVGVLNGTVHCVGEPVSSQEVRQEVTRDKQEVGYNTQEVPYQDLGSITAEGGDSKKRKKKKKKKEFNGSEEEVLLLPKSELLSQVDGMIEAAKVNAKQIATSPSSIVQSPSTIAQSIETPSMTVSGKKIKKSKKSKKIKNES